MHLLKAFVYSASSLGCFMATYFVYSGGTTAHASLVLAGLGLGIAALCQTLLALRKMTDDQRQLTFGYIVLGGGILVCIACSVIDKRMRFDRSVSQHRPCPNSAQPCAPLTQASNRPKARQ